MNEMTDINQNKPCRERGQSFVELAISLVILLLLVGGVVDLQRVNLTQHNVICGVRV